MNLSTPVSPGSGYRPLYSAMDVLQVATIWTVVQQGLPPARGAWIWQWVVRPRASALADTALPDSADGSLDGLLGQTGEVIAVTYIEPETGEPHTFTFRRGSPEADAADQALEAEDAPDAVFVINVDRLIGRIMRRLDQISRDDDDIESLGDVLGAALRETDE